MKYIKTYENVNIKKYLIMTEFDDFFLDEVVNINKEDNQIELKTIIFYNNLTDDVLHNVGSDKCYIDAIKTCIKYTTDDLDDAKKVFNEKVKLSRNIKKYNL